MLTNGVLGFLVVLEIFYHYCEMNLETNSFRMPWKR